MPKYAAPTEPNIPINTKSPGDCGYIAFFETRRIELYAPGIAAAKDKAVAHFKPSKSKRHLVSVYLAEKADGTPYIHSTTEI